jgi:hypothetical protein
VPEGTTREDARRILDEANACFAFAPLPSPAAGAPWRGTVTEKGTLRLVATGPGVFRAAAVRLR